MSRLTRAQVRAIDRRAIEAFHIPGIVLMENAARGAADVAWNMLGDQQGAAVDIVCGGGNNGGDGLAIARHLHNRGARVRILLAIDPAKYTGDALINWRIVQAMNLPTLPAAQVPPHILTDPRHLLIDALFGSGLAQPPRPDAAAIIDAINAQPAPVLAIDVPSGLDCDTGEPLGPTAVRATRTVTFVAEKTGFATPTARRYTGAITVKEIGCPVELLAAGGEEAKQAVGRPGRAGEN